MPENQTGNAEKDADLRGRIVQLAEEWEADRYADLTQRACAALLRAALDATSPSTSGEARDA